MVKVESLCMKLLKKIIHGRKINLVGHGWGERAHLNDFSSMARRCNRDYLMIMIWRFMTR